MSDKDIIDFETLLKEIQEQKKTIAELKSDKKLLVHTLKDCKIMWTKPEDRTTNFSIKVNQIILENSDDE